MRQTTVQEFNSIRFGSGKFEVEDSLGAWHNLGAMRDIQFEEEWDKIVVLSDNAGPIVQGIRNHMAALGGNLMEISLEKLSVLRGGMDEYEEDAGTPVVDEDQVILQGSWAFETWVQLDGQNADGTAPTVSAVVGSDSGALVNATDYNLAIGKNGKWGIVLHETGTLDTEAQNITVTSSYTPAEKKTLKSGGRQMLAARAVRVTNTNEDGDEFIITIYKATTEEGIVIDFQGDHEEDPAMVPIQMKGTMDESKSVGEQLFMIEDYQNV